MAVNLNKQKKFWDIINFLENIKEPVKVSEILSAYSLSSDSFFSLLNVFQQIGAEIIFDENKKTIYKMTTPSVHLDLNFFDLLKIESLKKNCEDNQDLDQSIVDTLKKISQKDQFDLFKMVNELGGIDEFASKNNIVNLGKKISLLNQEIYEILLNKNTMKVTLKNMDERIIYPHRIIKIEGELSLVGEDVTQGDCFHTALKNISCVKELFENFKPLYSFMEMNDYLNGLKAINEKSVRLILKIDDSVDITTPDFHYFGNPIMIRKNGKGAIWAASVHPCDDIYEWLCSMGQNIEIIDPSAFKRLFLKYCENKLSRVAN